MRVNVVDEVTGNFGTFESNEVTPGEWPMRYHVGRILEMFPSASITVDNGATCRIYQKESP